MHKHKVCVLRGRAALFVPCSGYQEHLGMAQPLQPHAGALLPLMPLQREEPWVCWLILINAKQRQVFNHCRTALCGVSVERLDPGKRSWNWTRPGAGGATIQGKKS